MQIGQQIVGVNQRLGNTAVPQMQGTTRNIYDSQAIEAATNQTLTFFQGVSSRTYPQSNLSNNRFEVGESLAIQGIYYTFAASSLSTISQQLQFISTTTAFTNTLNFNLYIGNQRVIKDLDLNYSKYFIGESKAAAVVSNVLHLETPIVIPPQIEFYATVRVTTSGNATAQRMYLGLFGQGTLLNTKSNF
jgi:hypothetical protein